MPKTTPSQPVQTSILTPDGLIPGTHQAASFAEAVSSTPQGVYTAARTFHGNHALLLDAHLDRLDQSARLVNIPVTYDRSRLRAALRELLKQAAYPDAKFLITLPHDTPEHIYLALAPYTPVPDEVQQHGASVIMVPLVRKNPVAKTTDWMTLRRPTFDNLPEGVYEAILTGSDGALLEGLSCNFYGILNGALTTADYGVLKGITRRAIFEIVTGTLPVTLTPVYKHQIPQLTEAMLTSSGRGVVPITMINGQPVGTGTPGPIVAAIRDRYDAWTESAIEPI
ncbi:MAG: aminotransferase class IV family protein [Anaerolineae bacterium]|nr:aminotransferase class IV family protein [Anaerolineae bacterium]